MLLVLDNVGRQGVSETKIHKILFLLKHEDKLGVPTEFKPYDYGPYSQDIRNRLDILSSKELISKENINTIDKQGTIIRLTQQGRIELTGAKKRFTEWEISRIKSQSYYWSTRPLMELLLYVYGSFPDYSVNSKLRRVIG